MIIGARGASEAGSDLYNDNLLYQVLHRDAIAQNADDSRNMRNARTYMNTQTVVLGPLPAVQCWLAMEVI